MEEEWTRGGWQRRHELTNPEAQRIKNEERIPMEITAERVNQDFVRRLARQTDLVNEIRATGYPDNEAMRHTCDQIGKRYGVGTDVIMLIARLLKREDTGATQAKKFH